MTSQSRLPRSSQHAEADSDNIELLFRRSSLQACVNETEQDVPTDPRASSLRGQPDTGTEDKSALIAVSSQLLSWLRAFMSSSPLLNASAAPSGPSYAAIPVRHDRTSLSPQLGQGKLRSRHNSSVKSTVSGGIGVHSTDGGNFFEDIPPLPDRADDDVEDAVSVASESSRSGDGNPQDNSPSVLTSPPHTLSQNSWKISWARTLQNRPK